MAWMNGLRSSFRRNELMVGPRSHCDGRAKAASRARAKDYWEKVSTDL